MQGLISYQALWGLHEMSTLVSKFAKRREQSIVTFWPLSYMSTECTDQQKSKRQEQSSSTIRVLVKNAHNVPNRVVCPLEQGHSDLRTCETWRETCEEKRKKKNRVSSNIRHSERCLEKKSRKVDGTQEKEVL